MRRRSKAHPAIDDGIQSPQAVDGQNMPDLTSHRAFDEYAARFGWVYDNGGRYLAEEWDWYAGGRAGLALLRQAPDQVRIVRIEGRELSEIWSGAIRTTDDFDRMSESVTRIVRALE